MKCISHNEIDAVNNCGNCGAGLCQECVKDTIFEKNNKPLCWNCNVQTALENDNIFRTDLGIKQITIGVYAVAIVIGLIFFAMGKLFSVRIGNLPPVVTMLIFWGIGGIIASFVNKIQSNAGFFYKILGYFFSGIISPITAIQLLFVVLKIKKRIVHNNEILHRLGVGNN